MAIDRHAAGLTILRICIGIFFVFEGIGKLGWLTDRSVLAEQLRNWSQVASTASLNHRYLERIAIPGVTFFARLVPLGELISGAALVAGFQTRLFAFVAFFMALNFQFASGALFNYSFLTSGYGLPVLGSTLALALAAPARRKVQSFKTRTKL
jgi:uncharacterized membrane protein YphA (DoxX/SURF4 family)